MADRIPVTDIPGDGFSYGGPVSPHLDHDGANLLALVAYYDAAAAVGRRRVLTKFAEVTAGQSAGALDAFKKMIDKSTEALALETDVIAQDLTDAK